MSAKRRLGVTLRKGEAMRVTRVSIGRNKLVYVILASRKFPYAYGKSRIIYIGTTRKGVGRIAGSAAGKADKILAYHGVREFHVRVITCRPRRNVQTWVKLERGLLLAFRERYGEVPYFNKQGRKMRERDEFEYFTRSRLRGILEELA